jgi:hypothetical protein
MSWFAALTGLFRPAKALIEVFTPNAENDAERGHAERMAVTRQDLESLQQFAAEFHTRQDRTWWDSFIDGLNRLPRPLITLGILAFFVLAPTDPEHFLQIARSYQMMPDGFWALLGVIVAFYFGGRMQLKRQDMSVKGEALAMAQGLIAERRAAAAAAEAEVEPDGQRAAIVVPPTPSPAPARADAGSTAAAPVSITAPLRQPNKVIEAWKERHAANG